MQRHSRRHGCLLVACGVGLGGLTTWAYDGDPAIVQSRVFEIEYDVNEVALPLETVELWYTQDEGRTWHRYGFDDDRQSPFTFQAPAEELYGFFLVLTNATGSSGKPPTQGTSPHQWAFVDYTPPVVQMHALRLTTALARRVLQIRWTAIDSNFGARPIRLEYQRLPDETWYPIIPDPLANTGRYDWRLPDGLVGAIGVRLTAADTGGHQVHSERAVIEVTPAAAVKTSSTPYGAASETSSASASTPAATVTSSQASARAARLYADALLYRDRGEHRQGIARLREAVRLDPQMTDAFAEMAGMLYILGDYDRALSAYEIALAQRPTMRKALQGAAMVHRQRHDYASAAENLRTILRYNPNDAEIWMNLGDVAIYRGDELSARDCYTRASQIDPSATEVVEAAGKRLAVMKESSRVYRSSDQ